VHEKPGPRTRARRPAPGKKSTKKAKK
jgi:hypothetical protein